MLSTLTITKKEYQLTQTLINNNPKGHELNRLRFIEYKYNKKTNVEISSLLGKCRKTLTNWTNKLRQEGVEKFIYVDYARRISKLEDIKGDIRKEVRRNGFKSLAELVDWIKTKGIETSISNAHYFIKKNSISLSRNLD
jgi:transposase